jgi:hypothetical protein
MTSSRQTEANRRNARKSTGPTTEEGKQCSRCNAVRHGLTAETVIGALEDAEDYKAFEAAITADYDAQSTVERELVLRLASVLWRLRRATTIETGLFEIQVEHMRGLKQPNKIRRDSREVVYALFRRAGSVSFNPDPASHGGVHQAEEVRGSMRKSINPTTEFANLPNYALDRLSRYEATLWRQAAQILFALRVLDRRKPWDRGRRFRLGSRRGLLTYDLEE